MGHRGTTRDLVILDQKNSRVYNGKYKNKERVRRHNRLIDGLKAGHRTPAILSWLSMAVNRPARKISEEDIQSFIRHEGLWKFHPRSGKPPIHTDWRKGIGSATIEKASIEVFGKSKIQNQLLGEEDFQKLIKIKKQLSDRIFGSSCDTRSFDYKEKPLNNIVGIGVGLKIINKKPTKNLCINFFVQKKMDKNKINEKDLLSTLPEVLGVPTDVIEIGVPVLFVQEPLDPLQPGGSIGPQKLPGNKVAGHGTLGAIVHKKSDPDSRYLLSAAHVLTHDGRHSKGADIHHPSHFHSPHSKTIGKITDISGDYLLDLDRIHIDASLAKINEGIQVDKSILDLGPPNSAVDSKDLGNFLFSPVVKFGRTTRKRLGIFNALAVDFVLTSRGKIKVYRDQVVIIPDTANEQSFAEPGDSGSLVLIADQTGNKTPGKRKVLGLVVGGGNEPSSSKSETLVKVAIATPFFSIINEFGIDF